MPNPVGANRCHSHSGCGVADISKFIRCVDGREPEVNEVWILGEDGVTPEVHPTAQVDIDAGVVCKFATNYLNENGFETSIFCKKIMNGSFEFISIPDPLRTKVTYWINNLLVPIPAWGVGGTVTNFN